MSVKTRANRARAPYNAPEAPRGRKEVGPAFAPVVRRPIAELRPYERNSRLHDPAQLEALRASMVEFGWTIPVLVDETGGVLAGHARLLVGAELGYSHAPVIVADGWSEGQKRAYIIADNKLTERGGWNWGLVAAEMKDIRDMGIDLALTGFEAHELEPLLEADWRTEEKSDATEKPHGATDGHSIHVTIEQYEIIQQAIAIERQAAGNAKMSEGKALERIASRRIE